MPFAFFSFASTKLPNYVALLLPALAILVALWFERVRAGEDRRAAVVSAATIPVFVGLVAFAIGAFSRSNRLDVDVAAVSHQLVFLGAAMLAGSLLTVAAIATRKTAQWAPYVLALTSGALVLFIALIAEPAVEPLKPIPPIARTIDTDRKSGDTIAIGGVSGGNGLIFYTRAAGARHQEQRGLRLDDLRQRRRVGGHPPARRAAPGGARALAPPHRGHRDADPHRAARARRPAAHRRPGMPSRLRTSRD